jgi:hypothetical protein
MFCYMGVVMTEAAGSAAQTPLAKLGQKIEEFDAAVKGSVSTKGEGAGKGKIIAHGGALSENIEALAQEINPLMNQVFKGAEIPTTELKILESYYKQFHEGVKEVENDVDASLGKSSTKVVPMLHILLMLDDKFRRNIDLAIEEPTPKLLEVNKRKVGETLQQFKEIGTMLSMPLTDSMTINLQSTLDAIKLSENKSISEERKYLGKHLQLLSQHTKIIVQREKENVMDQLNKELDLGYLEPQEVGDVRGKMNKLSLNIEKWEPSKNNLSSLKDALKSLQDLHTEIKNRNANFIEKYKNSLEDTEQYRKVLKPTAEKSKINTNLIERMDKLADQVKAISLPPSVEDLPTLTTALKKLQNLHEEVELRLTILEDFRDLIDIRETFPEHLKKSAEYAKIEDGFGKVRDMHKEIDKILGKAEELTPKEVEKLDKVQTDIQDLIEGLEKLKAPKERSKSWPGT